MKTTKKGRKKAVNARTNNNSKPLENDLGRIMELAATRSEDQSLMPVDISIGLYPETINGIFSSDFIRLMENKSEIDNIRSKIGEAITLKTIVTRVVAQIKDFEIFKDKRLDDGYAPSAAYLLDYLCGQKRWIGSYMEDEIEQLLKALNTNAIIDVLRSTISIFSGLSEHSVEISEISGKTRISPDEVVESINQMILRINKSNQTAMQY